MNQAKSPEDQIFSEEDITDSFYKGKVRFDEECESRYIKLDDGRSEYVNI